MIESQLFWIVGISYLAIGSGVLCAAYKRIDWHLSAQRGEEIMDVIVCYTLAIFWPFYLLLGLAGQLLVLIHKAMIRITE